MSEAKIIEQLEGLGYTKAEAEVLLVLLRLGSSTGGKLAKITGYSRPKVYEILEKLTRDGWLQVQLYGRPRVYSMLDPAKALDNRIIIELEKLRSKASKLEDYFKTIYEKQREYGVEEEIQITLLKSVGAYVDKLSKMILSAEQNILMICGVMLNREHLMLQNTLPKIRKKGVEIRAVTGEGLSLGEVSINNLKSLFQSGEIGILQLSAEASKPLKFPPFRITVVDEKQMILVFPRVHRGEIVSIIALYNSVKPLAESIAFIYNVVWKLASSTA
ncbi:MAG: TrmB family transcriptional regulator [Candidatus Lokiarchaeia archaeon]